MSSHQPKKSSTGLQTYASFPTIIESTRSLEREQTDPLVEEEGSHSPQRRPPLVLDLTHLSSAPNDEEAEDEYDTEPPSPVPTEIEDRTGEDFMHTAKKHGAKVRDFAYEDPLPGRVPALWLDPLFTLVIHDQHIRFPSEHRWELSGRELRRLLDHEFVTQEEADKNWQFQDKRRLEEFDDGPVAEYPFVISKKRPVKPTSVYRETLRRTLFVQDHAAPEDPAPRADIYVPKDTDDLWPGDEKTTRLFLDLRECEIGGMGSAMAYMRSEGGPPTHEQVYAARQELLRISNFPLFDESLSAHDSKPFATSTPLGSPSASRTNFEDDTEPPSRPVTPPAEPFATITATPPATPPAMPPPVAAPAQTQQTHGPALSRALGRTQTLWL